jgi:hypothetical protein
MPDIDRSTPQFCTHCGAPVSSPGRTDVGVTTQSIGTLSGVVAIFFVPPLFGLLGIVLGYLARKYEEEQLGMYAIITGIAGLVIGIFLAVVISGQTLGIY